MRERGLDASPLLVDQVMDGRRESLFQRAPIMLDGDLLAALDLGKDRVVGIGRCGGPQMDPAAMHPRHGMPMLGRMAAEVPDCGIELRSGLIDALRPRLTEGDRLLRVQLLGRGAKPLETVVTGFQQVI